MAQPRLKFWGWGYEGEALTPDEIRWLEGAWAKQFHVRQFDLALPPTAEEIQLRPSRLSVPGPLQAICTTEHYERLLHSYGASFPDSVRIFARDFANPPDVVAYPRHAQDVLALLDWCGEAGAAVIPFGGGTSVVGGVEPPPGSPAVVTVNMTRMNRVLHIDPTSQVALIQAGARGPERGMVEWHHFPASGAGPDPQRLWLGSEGILGIITQAWVRLRPRPTYRAAKTVRFPDFFRAAEAVRAISQAGLYPANCRLLDPLEALTNMVGDGKLALLLLAFESADHPVDAWLQRALELCADSGGEYSAEAITQQSAHRSGAAGQWRERFLRMPLLREELTARGIIADTFETAVTWEQFPYLYTSVKEATERAVRGATGQDGVVSCRLTHVYPGGPVVYFTFSGLGNKAALLEQFWAIKIAASDALVKAGGTITHHHAVGRDHRRWYDQERPELFASTLRAVKSALDPRWLLNPGVLIDP